MFTRVRRRLLAWNTLVLILLLLVVGTVIYVTFARSSRAELDSTLAETSDVTLRELREHGLRLDREGYSGGSFIVVTDGAGRLLANPQHVDFGAAPPPTSGGQPHYTTMTLAGNGPVRLYIRPLAGARVPTGTLIVGQSLIPRDQALHRILLVLLLVGSVGLLLALFGAWFLAGRALVPIQAAFNRQQEFVADAAHELRTPLMSLRAATDLLAQHKAEPLAANSDLFDDVRSELLRLERLAGDLLTLARGDLETLELALGTVDLGALAADVVRKTLPLAQEHDVQLILAPSDTLRYAEADPDRLQQVLLILLDNALKHTPTGGRITVTVARKGSEARVVIHDTGVGIPPEALPRLFDRFYRANRTRARRDGGAGLGLAIARGIIEAHGGQITIASTPGNGTSAIVRLPVSAPLDQMERREEVVPGQGARAESPR